MICNRRHFLSALGLLLPSLRLAVAQNTTQASAIAYLAFERVEALLLNAGGVPLPPALAGRGPAELRKAWPGWIERHDREIRARLLRGEEDSLVNFVLFGVSFTDQPRVGPDVREFTPANALINRRIQHFVGAIERPASNERLAILGNLLTRLGYGAASAEQKDRLTSYVSENVSRYFAEKQKYDLAVSRSASNGTAVTAQLYKDRGLSVDTDFRPNYAIERGLLEVRRRGLLKSVRRVAIIGPGLDFVDKDSGFDHYPLQTLQPFAVMDSLLRLGLSNTRDLRVTLFDISGSTLDHVNNAVLRARGGNSYSLQLVLDRTAGWNQEVVNYWLQTCNTLGDSATPVPLPPHIQNVQQRAIRIRSEIVRLLEPISLNAVVQNLNGPAGEKFDLILATNVFIYYDRFEQALSLLNIESMLAPGGVFLSNDVFEDYPAVRLRAIGTIAVDYASGQTDDMRLYSVPAFQPQLPPL